MEVEKFLMGPLYDPTTNKKTYGWKLGGKLDLIVKRAGRTVIMDHKTTSEDIGVDSGYWTHLRIDGQVSQYSLLAVLNGIQIDQVVWDVIRKPTIKQTQKETLEGYEQRLTDDCTKVRPEFYFQRQVAPQLDDSTLEYASDLPQIADDIRSARRRVERMRQAGHEVLPPKSTGSCFLYHTRCKFFGLCTGTDSISNWQKKEKKHKELDGVPEDVDLLTHSRIRTWQACQRKHYFEYELQIEKGEEDSDALRFGTLLHKGLEAWFLQKGKVAGVV
jgi:hypothetical protein